MPQVVAIEHMPMVIARILKEGVLISVMVIVSFSPKCLEI